VRETPATLRDIISVQSALAALLTEETRLMDTMQIAGVGGLQERKLKLTGMLERYMRYVQQHQEVVAAASQEDKAELRQNTAEFHRAMKKNYDTLLVARAVNKAVVKCVTQIMTRQEQNPVYNARGATKRNYRPLPVSITLNETA
jgi:hypothetical protein